MSKKRLVNQQAQLVLDPLSDWQPGGVPERDTSGPRDLHSCILEPQRQCGSVSGHYAFTDFGRLPIYESKDSMRLTISEQDCLLI